MPKADKPEDGGKQSGGAPTGKNRKWIWFRPSAEGRSPARKEFDALPPEGRGRLLKAVERYLKSETRRHDVDHLGGGIYELRTRVGNNHFRVLFFLWGQHCIALTAFYKNQQATPQTDQDRAKTRRAAWKKAFGDEPKE